MAFPAGDRHAMGAPAPRGGRYGLVQPVPNSCNLCRDSAVKAQAISRNTLNSGEPAASSGRPGAARVAKLQKEACTFKKSAQKRKQSPQTSSILS